MESKFFSNLKILVAFATASSSDMAEIQQGRLNFASRWTCQIMKAFFLRKYSNSKKTKQKKKPGKDLKLTWVEALPMGCDWEMQSCGVGEEGEGELDWEASWTQ